MNTEARIQQEIVKYFRNNYCLNHHSPQYAIFSVPNESKNAKDIAVKKATGLMPGASDLIVMLDRGRTAFIEVKTATGAQSAAQKTFERIARGNGHQYFIVRSLKDFQAVLSLYDIEIR